MLPQLLRGLSGYACSNFQLAQRMKAGTMVSNRSANSFFLALAGSWALIALVILAAIVIPYFSVICTSIIKLPLYNTVCWRCVFTD